MVVLLDCPACGDDMRLDGEAFTLWRYCGSCGTRVSVFVATTQPPDMPVGQDKHAPFADLVRLASMTGPEWAKHIGETAA